MTAGNPEFFFSVGLIDDATLFTALFSTTALIETFESNFATTTGKGTDRLNGFQFSLRANQELAVASTKCASSQYRFAPYLENLKTKGDVYKRQPSPLAGEGRGEGAVSRFTPEQQHWLEMIRDHIAANLGIAIDDFEYAPFNTEGGLGRVHQLFGEQLLKVIEELNRELVA